MWTVSLMDMMWSAKSPSFQVRVFRGGSIAGRGAEADDSVKIHKRSEDSHLVRCSHDAEYNVVVEIIFRQSEQVFYEYRQQHRLRAQASI